jgi:hypothetical protein
LGPHVNKKKGKIQKNQKILEVKTIYELRRIKIYKIKKFNNIFSSNEDFIGKENSILRRKI